MTPQEWQAIAAKMQAWWPHSKVGTTALVEWYDELADLPAQTTYLAVRELCAGGLQHMPNWAAIRDKAVDLAVDAPDWPQVVELLPRVAARMPTAYDRDRREQMITAALALAPPVVAGWIQYVGWKSIRHVDLTDRTAYAQLRDTYTAYIGRSKENARLRNLPPGTGLKKVETARATKQPENLTAAMQTVVNSARIATEQQGDQLNEQ